MVSAPGADISRSCRTGGGEQRVQHQTGDDPHCRGCAFSDTPCRRVHDEHEVRAGDRKCYQ